MKRVCFLLQLKKDRIDDYLEVHQVWPKMLKTIQSVGIKNYSLFIKKDSGLLVGYFEAEDPEKSLTELGKTAVSRQWQKEMAEYFESGSGDTQKGGTEWLDQYFYLD